MSATIGVALKKIAVDLLTNPKILKTIVGIVIGIIIVVFFPLMVVISILNGNVDVDTNKLAAIVEENISDEQMAQLNLYNDTMEKIENELDDKKLPEYKTQAEIIYAFYLSDKLETKDFVKSFTSCFEKI